MKRQDKILWSIAAVVAMFALFAVGLLWATRSTEAVHRTDGYWVHTHDSLDSRDYACFSDGKLVGTVYTKSDIYFRATADSWKTWDHLNDDYATQAEAEHAVEAFAQKFKLCEKETE